MKRGSSPTQRAGAAAEDEALAYLQACGLELVARNFHCRMGEIDLVMREGTTLVVIEVRRRRSRRFGDAAETVDVRKQARLVRTTGFLLQRNRALARCDIRFDVFAINEDGLAPRVTWVRGAFDATADPGAF